MQTKQNSQPSEQPTKSEQVNPKQKQQRQQEIAARKNELTINPGDRIDDNTSLEEKAQQVAVDTPDITGDHVTVPTYFVVEGESGDKKALHHVRDAEEISDTIRQARVDENGDRVWD